MVFFHILENYVHYKYYFFLIIGNNKHQSAVTCLQFNSKFVITSSDDGTVKLWDVKSGKLKNDDLGPDHVQVDCRKK